jgi:phosphopantetheinyl transferase
VALLAFAQGRALGVDVEKVREDFDHEAIARRFFFSAGTASACHARAAKWENFTSTCQ